MTYDELLADERATQATKIAAKFMNNGCENYNLIISAVLRYKAERKLKRIDEGDVPDKKYPWKNYRPTYTKRDVKKTIAWLKKNITFNTNDKTESIHDVQELEANV